MKTSHLLGALLGSVLALGTGVAPVHAASSDIKIVLRVEAHRCCSSQRAIVAASRVVICG